MSGIPFVREFDFEYGKTSHLSKLIRRVIAPNPGPFTYTGTGTYIIGHGEVAVIDPGPHLKAHEIALDQALANDRVTHVFVTHHHRDHSPLAHPLATKHGCKVYGFGAPARSGDGTQLEEGDDTEFRPDTELVDNQVIAGAGWTIEALHTPGHTSNHMCYALSEENTLFCGDHIMAWATSVVIPPDGHMGDYLDQLRRIRDLEFAAIWPTHGPAIQNTRKFLDAYIEHRLNRETQILELLNGGPHDITALVAKMYADIDKRLHPAAAYSVLGHMIHLVETKRIGCDGIPGFSNSYWLA
jgi:glyoxylase-like metal-dependent hydrolase (beta-lactamase superfamily II)